VSREGARRERAAGGAGCAAARLATRNSVQQLRLTTAACQRVVALAQEVLSALWRSKQVDSAAACVPGGSSCLGRVERNASHASCLRRNGCKATPRFAWLARCGVPRAAAAQRGSLPSASERRIACDASATLQVKRHARALSSSLLSTTTTARPRAPAPSIRSSDVAVSPSLHRSPHLVRLHLIAPLVSPALAPLACSSSLSLLALLPLLSLTLSLQ
jgi:hypothetical protein